MQEICAAKALTWFRELDKDFRSSKAGGQCEAVLNLAPRLLQWSLEPPVSEAAAELLKLEAGQDQAYATAIMLRLAETFRSGNNLLRLCVLKVFLVVRRGHQNKKSSCESLLSKSRITGHAEILRIVRSVVGCTDLTARCLALCALGCLARLQGDSSELHRLVLESIDSKHEPEVEAALFAAGCISEISASFAAVCLNRITELVISDCTPTRLKLGGIRLLSEMWLSASTAHNAHKIGRKFILDQHDEDIVKAALTALSVLAGRSKSLLPDHIQLLLECIISDPRTSVKVNSFVNLSKLLPMALSYMQLDLQAPLQTIIGDMKAAPILRSKALHVLEKVSVNTEIAWSQELISSIEMNAQDQDFLTSSQACSLLVELSCKPPKATATIAGVDLFIRAALLICDRIDMLSSLDDAGAVHCGHFIRSLATRCPRSCDTIVERLSGTLRNIISKEKTTQEAQVDSSGDTVMSDAVDVKKVGLLCRCLLICGRHLDLGDSKVYTTCKRFRDVAEVLSSSSAFDEAYMNTLPAFLNAFMLEGSVTGGSAVSKVQAMADGLLQSSRFWSAYKLARTSCRFGLWKTSEQVFNILQQEVTSESSFFWLKALSLLSSAEAILSNRDGYLEAGAQSLPLLEASVKSLQAAAQSDRPFDFQRRFIRLRIRLVQIAMDVLVFCQSNERVREAAAGRKFLMSSCGKAEVLVSLLQDLAQDFYMLTISLTEMDINSLQVLYGGMIQCSLLAFSTAFATLPLLSRTNSSECACNADVFAEVRRFVEGQATFEAFLATLGRIASGDLRYRKDVQWFRTQPVIRAVTTVWNQVLEAKAEVLLAADGALWSQKKGIPYLKAVVDQFICLTWVLPNFFFSSRPRMQLELFVSQSGASRNERSEHICIAQGSALSLRVGLQIANVDPRLKLRRLACILTASSQESSSQYHSRRRRRRSFKHWCFESRTREEERMLNWLLAQSEVSEEDVGVFMSLGLDDHHLKQGFSSCTLDTASLASGVYEILCFAVCKDKDGFCWTLPCPNFRPRFKVV